MASEPSGLRLRRDVPGLGARARLAGRRYRGATRGGIARAFAHRLLADQEILDLVAGERLVFDQALRQQFEVGAVLGDDLLRELIAVLDEALDLAVDLLDRLLRDILLARHRITEKNFFLVLAIGDRSEL